MFGLTMLRNALSALTANLTGLAATVKDIDNHLRQRAALDAPEAEAPALPPPDDEPARPRRKAVAS